MTQKFLALALSLMLTACADEPAAVKPLTLDYTRLGKITLAVGKLEFTNRAALTPAKDADYFKQFQPQLADGLYRWGADRLQAGGKQGSAVMIIQDAVFTREILPHRTDIGSWFTREQGEKWSGRATVEINVRDAADNFNGKANTTVTHTATLPEEATEAERQATYRRLLLGMLDDLNVQMERAVREHLNAVVLTMPQSAP